MSEPLVAVITITASLTLYVAMVGLGLGAILVTARFLRALLA